MMYHITAEYIYKNIIANLEDCFLLNIHPNDNLLLT